MLCYPAKFQPNISVSGFGTEKSNSGNICIHQISVPTAPPAANFSLVLQAFILVILNSKELTVTEISLFYFMFLFILMGEGRIENKPKK